MRDDPAACALCGVIAAKSIATAHGRVCAGCLLVCVDVAFDRLARAMSDQFDRDPEAALALKMGNRR